MNMAEDIPSLSGLNLDDSFLNADRDASSFITLTSCTWEQDVSGLKVYIPLRGVHTDMVRTHFTRHSVEASPPPPFRCNCRVPSM